MTEGDLLRFFNSTPEVSKLMESYKIISAQDVEFSIAEALDLATAFGDVQHRSQRILNQMFYLKLQALKFYGDEAKTLFQTEALTTFIEQNKQDFTRLKPVMLDAFSHALQFARQRRLGLKAVEFASTEQWNTLDQEAFRQQIAKQYGLPNSSLNQIVLFPIKVDEDWLFWLPKDSDQISKFPFLEILDSKYYHEERWTEFQKSSTIGTTELQRHSPQSV